MKKIVFIIFILIAASNVYAAEQKIIFCSSSYKAQGVDVPLCPSYCRNTCELNTLLSNNWKIESSSFSEVVQLTWHSAGGFGALAYESSGCTCLGTQYVLSLNSDNVNKVNSPNEDKLKNEIEQLKKENERLKQKNISSKKKNINQQ